MNCFMAAIIAMTKTASPIADVHWADGLPENQEPLAGYFPRVKAFIKGQPIGKQIAWKTKSASAPSSSFTGQISLNQ
jgi:hypothetical protein